LPEADVGGVEPTDDRLEPKELRVGHQRQRDVVRRRLRLYARVALHDLDHVPAVDLEDLPDVDSGNLERHQHLDHELVARGRHELGRRAKPARQLVGARGGDPVALLRPLAVPVALDEPVTLEPLQRRIDLADVERPDLARPRLELVLQAQAVLRLLAEQGKKRMGNAHVGLLKASILSMYTKYNCRAQVPTRFRVRDRPAPANSRSAAPAAPAAAAGARAACGPDRSSPRSRHPPAGFPSRAAP
jgi:hypothetical protein